VRESKNISCHVYWRSQTSRPEARSPTSFAIVLGCLFMYVFLIFFLVRLFCLFWRCFFFFIFFLYDVWYGVAQPAREQGIMRRADAYCFLWEPPERSAAANGLGGQRSRHGGALELWRADENIVCDCA